MVEHEGRIGVLTGAASGIGRASARLLAAEGAHVSVADVDCAGGAETVRPIRESGGSAEFRFVDVADACQVAAMVESVIGEHGRLDFAHNNAGICPLGYSVDTLPTEMWERVIVVNLTGVWHCLKYELAVMCRQRSGAIVNTSSVSGIRG